MSKSLSWSSLEGLIVDIWTVTTCVRRVEMNMYEFIEKETFEAHRKEGNQATVELNGCTFCFQVTTSVLMETNHRASHTSTNTHFFLNPNWVAFTGTKHIWFPGSHLQVLVRSSFGYHQNIET